jgi:transcriptional regulator with XRE-family HTH domain
MHLVMPRPSTLKLPEIDLGDESIGERIARHRKAHGLTQVQLAKKMGLTRALISSYESGRLRLHAGLLARFALALNVSTDTLLGSKADKKEDGFSLKVVRRMKKIDTLPTAQQKVLLSTIDNFLKGVGS